MNNNVLVAVLAVVIVGAILFFAFGGSNDAVLNTTNTGNTPTTTQSQNTNTNTTNNTTGNTNTNTLPNRVTLAETESGNTVTVASAALTKSGYIVIYKVNSNGESSVVGQSDLLKAGAHSDVKVQVNAPLAEKQAVVAVLHEDDGDEKFEYPDADLYLENSGGLIVSDIDVVGVDGASDENKVLQAQVEKFLKDYVRATTTIETN